MNGVRLMTWGRLKELLVLCPDDAYVLVDDGDLRFAEVWLRRVMDRTKDQPPVVWLETGQIWNEELDIDRRLDEYLGY